MARDEWGARRAGKTRARETNTRRAEEKTISTPARSPPRRDASPAFGPSMRHRSSDRAIRPIASRRPPPLATPREWTVARVDDHARDDARATTTRDDATRDATRDNKIKSHRSRRLARHRASRSSPFDRSIHPSARIRATSPAVVRPARTTVDIPRADCASHARGKSIDTHVRPGGSPSHYFDDVKCYLFRVDNTVSRINDPRLWTLCTMVDPVHDTERHGAPARIARARARSIDRSFDRSQSYRGRLCRTPRAE